MYKRQGQALPSIASFDENGRVMHLISFSKTISPGLRVGAAVGNPDLLRRMTIDVYKRQQFTACSGNSPVCLKPVGRTIKRRSSP